MSGENQDLIRYAVWIHEQLSTRRSQVVLPQLSIERWGRVQRLHRRLAIATERNWASSVATVRSELHDAIRGLRYSLTEFDERLNNNVEPLAVLSPREILGGLQALRDEFESVEFDLRHKLIRVTTDPIELEGLYLGPFEIELNLLRRDNGGSARYRVVARDPQPSRRNSDVTHPHVHSEQLCEGEGQAPIQRALVTGRLYDFFVVVMNILRTYNSSSPHVPIEKWDGMSCHGCGDFISDDDYSACTRCGVESCRDCSTYCSICEDQVCQECAARCPGCDEWFCAGCLTECEGCSMELCTTCLNEQRRCNDCHERELKEIEELDESLAEPCADPASAKG